MRVCVGNIIKKIVQIVYLLLVGPVVVRCAHCQTISFYFGGRQPNASLSWNWYANKQWNTDEPTYGIRVNKMFDIRHQYKCIIKIEEFFLKIFVNRVI